MDMLHSIKSNHNLTANAKLLLQRRKTETTLKAEKRKKKIHREDEYIYQTVSSEELKV